MILYFSDSTDALSRFEEDSIAHLVQELVRASHQGYHYVVIGRSTCRWLRENVDLGALLSKRLRDLENSATQKEAMLRDCPSYLEICLGHTPLEQSTGMNFRIGHAALLKTRILEKSVLLVENSRNDGALIKEILNNIKKQHPVKNFDFECSMGGGSTIVAALEDMLRERRGVTVVTDSDKAFPGAGLSPTVRALNAISQQERFIGFIGCLPCRDIENLIPLGVIKEARIRPEYPDHWLQFLLSIAVTAEHGDVRSCPLLYFDMKNGVSIEKISMKAQKSAERLWIESTFSHDGKLKDIPGFGESMLKDIVQSGAGMALMSEQIRGKDWQEKFGELFFRIIWQMAADKRVAT